MVHVVGRSGAEQWNRVARLLQAGQPVTMSVDVQASFHDDDLQGHDIVGEIPGGDPVLSDQLVMLGAHFDSWHPGTGSTDNGIGSAVVMEAARLLKSLPQPPRRTIRIALWTGEEQGLLGCAPGFATPTGRGTAPAGGGQAWALQRGQRHRRHPRLPQGNGNIAPCSTPGLPFADKVKTSPRRTPAAPTTWRVDAGLLAQFIEDRWSTDPDPPLQRHRAARRHMKLNAAVVAAFVYLTANRPELLP
jgi:hypothetical protein